MDEKERRLLTRAVMCVFIVATLWGLLSANPAEAIRDCDKSGFSWWLLLPLGLLYVVPLYLGGFAIFAILWWYLSRNHNALKTLPGAVRDIKSFATVTYNRGGPVLVVIAGLVACFGFWQAHYRWDIRSGPPGSAAQVHDRLFNTRVAVLEPYCELPQYEEPP